jgi:hypothetical protein
VEGPYYQRNPHRSFTIIEASETREGPVDSLGAQTKKNKQSSRELLLLLLFLDISCCFLLWGFGSFLALPTNKIKTTMGVGRETPNKGLGTNGKKKKISRWDNHSSRAFIQPRKGYTYSHAGI